MAKIIKFLKDIEITEGELILGSESFGTSAPTSEQLEENELFFVLATDCTAHTFVEVENPSHENLAQAACCISPALYYKLCSKCGEASTTETYEYGSYDEYKHRNVSYVNATCTEYGHWRCDDCKNTTDIVDTDRPTGHMCYVNSKLYGYNSSTYWSSAAESLANSGTDSFNNYIITATFTCDAANCDYNPTIDFTYSSAFNQSGVTYHCFYDKDNASTAVAIIYDVSESEHCVTINYYDQKIASYSDLQLARSFGAEEVYTSHYKIGDSGENYCAVCGHYFGTPSTGQQTPQVHPCIANNHTLSYTSCNDGAYHSVYCTPCSKPIGTASCTRTSDNTCKLCGGTMT